MISEENMPQPCVTSPKSSSLCHLAEKPSIFLAEDGGGANGMFATNFQVTHALQTEKNNIFSKIPKMVGGLVALVFRGSLTLLP